MDKMTMLETLDCFKRLKNRIANMDDEMSKREQLELAMPMCENVHPFSVAVGEVVFRGILAVFEESNRFAVRIAELAGISDGFERRFEMKLGFFPLNGRNADGIDLKSIIKAEFKERSLELIDEIDKAMNSP